MRKKILAFIERVLNVFLDNLYIKPKAILSLLICPSQVFGVNYFPDQEQKSKCRIFWDQLRNIIKYGAIDDFYYLYGLNVKGGRCRKDYMHYRPFMHRRDQLNLSSRFNSSCILRNKLYFGIFAKAIGIATPENVAYIKGNDVLLLDSSSHTNIKDFINSNNGVFFCKPIDGECGTGVFKLELVDNAIIVNNTIVNLESIYNTFGDVAFLVQKCIQQHPLQAQLHPSSINSIRMVTVRSMKDGHIEVLPSILRIGTHGSVVDNTSQGGVAVGFDLNTGRLNEYGFQKPQFGLRLAMHPDTNIRFAEYFIPHIKTAIEQARYFHSFLDLHSIGWDIAIGMNGPIFIEGNDNWEINGPQSCNRGLSQEFYNLFYD